MIDPAPTTGTPGPQDRESLGSTGRNTPHHRERSVYPYAGGTWWGEGRPQPNLSRAETQKPQPDAGRVALDAIEALIADQATRANRAIAGLQGPDDVGLELGVNIRLKAMQDAKRAVVRALIAFAEEAA